jgi:hypothetical protein
MPLNNFKVLPTVENCSGAVIVKAYDGERLIAVAAISHRAIDDMLEGSLTPESRVAVIQKRDNFEAVKRIIIGKHARRDFSHAGPDAPVRIDINGTDLQGVILSAVTVVC